MKITDVTLKRYSASREARADAASIQVVEVHALATLASVPVSPWNLQMVHVHLAAGLPNVTWIEYFMPDNPLLEFQARLFTGPVLREERRDDGILLVPPDGPGLGLALDPEFAAASLVPE